MKPETSIFGVPRPIVGLFVFLNIEGAILVTQSTINAQHFEEKLLQQQADLQQATLSAVEQGRETSTDDTQDVADQAVASYQKELLFSQGTNGHVQLTRIRAALTRIADGTFGECLNCGKTIGVKRLEALPWTPYCIDCQEKIEKGELEDPVRAA
jgi:DnaK suppressor protein